MLSPQNNTSTKKECLLVEVFNIKMLRCMYPTLKVNLRPGVDLITLIEPSACLSEESIELSDYRVWNTFISKLSYETIIEILLGSRTIFIRLSTERTASSLNDTFMPFVCCSSRGLLLLSFWLANYSKTLILKDNKKINQTNCRIL